MSGRLDGRAVLVAGAGSQIGVAVARRVELDGGIAALADPDPASPGAWRHAFAGCVDAHGRIDAFVNAAGSMGSLTVDEASADLWTRLAGAGVDGIFLGCKQAIETMHELGAESGAIANVSAAVDGSLAGAAVWGANRMFTKNAALHCAARRLPIRCNSVRVRPERAEQAAALVSFLISDEAGFITGAELAI